MISYCRKCIDIQGGGFPSHLDLVETQKDFGRSWLSSPDAQYEYTHCMNCNLIIEKIASTFAVI